MTNSLAPPENPTDLLSEAQIIAAAAPLGPPRVGIYFLIRDGGVAYVGQARDVVLRVADHAKWRRFDHWAWVPCAIGDLNRVERAYLDAFIPGDNRDPATIRLKGGWAAWTASSAASQAAETVPEPQPELHTEAPPAYFDRSAAQTEWMRRLRMMKADPTLTLKDFGPSPFARE